MTSRTWLAVLLCFLVWFVYLKWFAPPPPPPQGNVATNNKASVSSPQTSTNNKGSGASADATFFFGEAPGIGSLQQVSTPKSTWEFSDVGGRPVRVVLNDYHVAVDDSSPNITTVSPVESPFSLATLFTNSKLKPFGTFPYQVDRQNKSIIFTGKSKDGLVARKQYSWGENPYVLSFDLLLSFPTDGPRNWGYLVVPLGGTGLKYEQSEPLRAWESVFEQAGSVNRELLSDLETTGEVYQGETKWLAFGNRYFASAAVNQSELNPDVVVIGNSQFQGGYLRFPLRLRQGQDTLAFKFQLYSGPKDLKYLEGVSSLTALVDYGFFSILAFPLLQLLKFFYGFCLNYGVAIILLTLLVRILFYPLTAKSMSSMKEMQKLQPQIAALKEKYKDDRERLNREQMALFKTHKVNPAAGCLPMLVQLPVFIALYQVLANSMELFHAPFFWWVQDLSAKDPYWIYPILMGLSMVVQQKLTPTAGMDPAQQKMMMLMPIVFTFLMVSLPSGLTLYIFVSTLLGIAQQVVTTRGTKVAAVVPNSAKRAPEKG